MSDDEVKSIFGGLNLNFNDDDETITETISPPRNEKKAIARIAETTNFSRTREAKPEPKVIPMSISLFPDEHKIMAKAISAYEQTPEYIGTKASRSDVIRAALYHFDKSSLETQVEMISVNRGRPKK